MRRRWMILTVVAAAALAATLGPGGHATRPAAAAPIGGHCFITDVFYDVTDVSLDERVAAHWDYDGDSASDAGLPGKATLDTVATGAVRWHEDRAPAARRRRYKQIGMYEDLRGQCRVPNHRQGQVDVTVPGVSYTLDGTWSTTGQSGTCHTTKVAARKVFGQLIRLSLDTTGKVHTVGFRWDVSPPPDLDCPFSVYYTDPGEGTVRYLPSHLRYYTFKYAGPRLHISKRTLTGKRVITIPIDITSKIQSTHGGLEPVWDGGKVQRTMHVTGSVTLRRYKACTITPRTDLLKSRCEYP